MTKRIRLKFRVRRTMRTGQSWALLAFVLAFPAAGILPAKVRAVDPIPQRVQSTFLASSGKLAEGAAYSDIAANDNLGLANRWNLNASRNADLAFLVGHENRSAIIPSPAASAALFAMTGFNYNGCKDTSSDRGRRATHRTKSYIYWGGPIKFATPRGASGSAGGHGRRHAEALDFISAPFDAGKTGSFRAISWKAVPPRGGVKFQVRYASRCGELDDARWEGPGGPDTFYLTPGSTLKAPNGYHWMQYKATLTSSGEARRLVLRSVTITFVPR